MQHHHRVFAFIETLWLLTAALVVAMGMRALVHTAARSAAITQEVHVTLERQRAVRTAIASQAPAPNPMNVASR